ncbi:MAG: hypothetical protein QM775_16610 [Pirellulales bacterium]
MTIEDATPAEVTKEINGLPADYGTPEYEAKWIRGKLNLPEDAPTSGVQGKMHCVCADAHGYQTYIAAFRCDDKQGEIARLTHQVAALQETLEKTSNANRFVADKYRATIAEIAKAARIVLEKYRAEGDALANYFAKYGAEHETCFEDDGEECECAEDDTCECPLIVAMHETENELREAIATLANVIAAGA